MGAAAAAAAAYMLLKDDEDYERGYNDGFEGEPRGSGDFMTWGGYDRGYDDGREDATPEWE